MINIKTMSRVILLIFAVVISSCSGSNPENKNVPAEAQSKPAPVVSVDTETTLLLSDLEENGDYVNSQVFPSLIKASVVHEDLGKNILVVDLRDPSNYRAGHIKGAVNKRFEDLPLWFETGIKPFEYDKIIMVCDVGQLSSYATCLLRLMGYGNVFAMRWGMSSWNKSLANDGWFKGVSGNYEAQLETKDNEKPAPLRMPVLGTGMSTGADIGTARFRKLFEEGKSNIQVTAEEVFANPQAYYIINLERKDKYEDGHIPGAVRYKPDATLGFIEEMATIPTDKTVVIYCGTGHNSAFATAFLRLFGYDARTLKYGNNGFMYNKMLAQKSTLSWLPFSDADVNNFELVK